MAGWVQAISLVKDFVPRLIDVDNLLKAFLNSRRDDAATMRSSLEEVNATHSGLQRSLDQQTQALTALTDEVYALRVTTSSLADRFQSIEESTAKALLWARITGVLAFLAIVGIGVLIFLLHRHQMAQ